MTVRTGWIYVMVRQDGVRKLGFTANVSRRRSQLGGSYGSLRIEKIWKMSWRSASYIEAKLHSDLKAFRYREGFARELYTLSLARLVHEVNLAIDFFTENVSNNIMTYDVEPERRVRQPVVFQSNLDPDFVETLARISQIQADRRAVVEAEETRIGRQMSRVEIANLLEGYAA